MSLHRIRRNALLLIFCLLFMPLAATAATAFYVDNGRTTNGNGTAASPWKLRSNISWTTVTTALSSGSVTIYFSSRARWDDTGNLIIGASGTASFPLTLDGHSQYNLTASGTASWQSETVDANRATFGSTTNNSGGIYFATSAATGRSYVTFKGFYLDHPKYGIVLSDTSGAHGQTNLHDLVIENNVVDSPQDTTGGAQGIYGGGMTTNCYNITVRRNTIINSKQEAIYVGQFDYLADTITGTVVEYNTVINSGIAGEGDIDIKPGNFGAIVRYNTSHTVDTGRVLGGIVVAASDVQVYGNEMYNLQPRDVGDGGHGIEINADGDGTTGKNLANILVYNNLFHGNAQEAIAIFATKANITNLKILNNTFVSDSQPGLSTSASGGHTIGITALVNNIFQTNTTYEVQLSSGTTITSADYNLFYHPASTTINNYQGVNKTWAQWQALGFDAHGINANASLDSAYVPLPTSPVINAGTVRSEFTVDKSGAFRPAPWDIGAYEYGAVPVPTAPQGLRITP